jgi:hypothetical protein
LLNRLSFEFQVPVFVLSVSALDITPPLVAGEERSYAMWPGYPLDAFSRSHGIGNVHTTLRPRLPAIDTAM